MTIIQAPCFSRRFFFAISDRMTAAIRSLYTILLKCKKYVKYDIYHLRLTTFVNDLTIKF